MTYSIPVYHIDTNDRIDKYIKDEIFLKSLEDGDWLGSGMYFWDNRANMNYWYRIKAKKFPSKNFAGVQVQQNFLEEELLDLTDTETLSKILGYVDFIGKMRSSTADIEKHFGALLNALYKMIELKPELFDFSFSVIRGSGMYGKTKIRNNEKQLIDEKLTTFPHLTAQVKTIYLFKHDDFAVKGTKKKIDISTK
ncbi:alpha-mannosyltransferase [Fructobacillus ficulneus]|uniref:Uncharacterized protein n=1 Tax=Fructobacillus ficulneus TaxID=157463 RepID=A0A0K8MH01_9LACO|nr:hypothetical protein [Fructobacillus ficulneus]GAO99815.1 hypothetical protein FFIC_240900 [Fructobacillus ficulneus]